MRFSLRSFTRHYAEMVVAMFAGMAVLGLVAEAALAAAGSGSSELAPDVQLLGMATAMTVPMVGWMRYRGHAWRPCLEMAASMYVPTVAAMALLRGGAVGDVHAAMAIQHVAMFPAMLGAMLLRPLEYGHAHAPRSARLA
jgi:hypothetical protein